MGEEDAFVGTGVIVADIADGVAVVAGGTAVTMPTQPTIQSIIVPLERTL